LEHIDWRVAWSADSHISRGLYTGLREATSRGADTRLVFFSDGQQFPPEPEFPHFDGQAGAVSGLIVGVGGSQAVPIPRLDKENRPIGFWEYVDLRDYLPASALPKDGSSLYLSRLDEPALNRLATITGLSYHRLETPEGLSHALLAPDLAAERSVAVDLRWIMGLLALILMLITRITFSPTRRSLT
jgi:mxaL protein